LKNKLRQKFGGKRITIVEITVFINNSLNLLIPDIYFIIYLGNLITH